MEILRKPQFLQFFALFFPISNIISDVITLIVRILEIIFGHFVYNMTKYTCTNYYVKSIFLSGFIQGGHYVPPSQA